MPQMAFGQDDAAKQQVVKAIKSLVNSEVSMSGQVEEEMPDADENSPLEVLNVW